MNECPKCGVAVEATARFCPECGFHLSEAPFQTGDPFVGKVIAGNYRLEESIGSGAMGTIYRATQLSLNKKIVIKLLHRHLLGDPTLAKRFEREAKAASLLDNPNCINVIDFGQTDDGTLYIAMEFIEGVDLAELVYQEHPLAWRRIISIVKQICTALDEAHANGVLHRDLKPENIMITQRRNQADFVKVLDFGIAKLQESSRGGAGTFQTQAGVVCGTPEYMSPEQARGQKLDARTDLYSLGILLYQLITNDIPFDGDSALAIVTKHLAEDPPLPSALRPDVPPALERLTMSLMQKDRDMRPATALDVSAELDRIERELEARPDFGGEDNDRTIVELKPVQLAQLEAAKREYEAKRRAPTAMSQGVADTVPAESDQLTNAVREALGSQNRPVQRPSGAAPAARRSATPQPSGSGAKLWIISVVVALVVAAAGWLVYQAVASAPASSDAPSLRLPASPGHDTAPASEQGSDSGW